MRVTTTNPSSLSSRAHLVATITAAAFVAQYATMFFMPTVNTALGSPPPVPITMIFFVGPARRSGTKGVTLWMTPRVLTLNYLQSRLVSVLYKGAGGPYGIHQVCVEYVHAGTEETRVSAILALQPRSMY